MTRFTIPTTVEKPYAPAGAQWEWETRVKVFTANTAAALETAMNAWLAALPTQVDDPSVLRIDALQGNPANDFKVAITYGYFVQV